jgi:hypothetical protein
MSERVAQATATTTGPAGVLVEIARELRAEGTVISPHVVDPPDTPTIGLLVALGPSRRGLATEYAGIVERVREGYLLHYEAPRVIAGADRDLALLAGDHLYALGLERLARLGDLETVRELADLISLCAQLHSDSRGGAETARALWLATAAAIAGDANERYRAAKAAVRDGAASAAEALRVAASEMATAAGLEAPLAEAADALESAADRGAS